jgi:hypothetical protein
MDGFADGASLIGPWEICKDFRNASQKASMMKKTYQIEKQEK